MRARYPSAEPAVAGAGRASTRRGTARRRKLVVAAMVSALVLIVVVVVSGAPFDGDADGDRAAKRSGTSLTTVAWRSLSSQTLVDGTLGFASASDVVVPAGASAPDLRKAQHAATAAQVELDTARRTLAMDAQTLTDARAKLAADRRKLIVDCSARAGGSAPGGGGAGDGAGDAQSNTPATSPCSTAAQAVTGDESAVTAAEEKAATDRGSVASAQATLVGAREDLADAEAAATGRQSAALYTMLPSPGKVIRRGEPLYAIDGTPTLLLYGRTTAWRAFRLGMSAGDDVAALNANLRALGYGAAPGGDRFTDATATAIRALQKARGLPPTGALLLGSVAFKPQAVRIEKVSATVGQGVRAGPSLSVTSTRPQVVVKLDAGRQRQVGVGDSVAVTLPNGRTTRGRVSYVSPVASTSSKGGGGDDKGKPTVSVRVRLLDTAAVGRLDKASVAVAITTSRVKRALVVPVNALLAVAGGGYVVEVVHGGAHRLVPVELGLFDDVQGLVQVRSARLRAGQQIVVPST